MNDLKRVQLIADWAAKYGPEIEHLQVYHDGVVYYGIVTSKTAERRIRRFRRKLELFSRIFPGYHVSAESRSLDGLAAAAIMRGPNPDLLLHQIGRLRREDRAYSDCRLSKLATIDTFAAKLMEARERGLLNPG